MSRSAAQTAFEALSDSTRRQILHLLSESEETSAGAIADTIDEVGRTAVSSHLRVLRNAQLIVERKEGRYRYYSLHPDGPVQDALGYLQAILSQGVSRGTGNATSDSSPSADSSGSRVVTGEGPVARPSHAS